MPTRKNGPVARAARWAVLSHACLGLGCATAPTTTSANLAATQLARATIEELPTPVGLGVAEVCFNASDDNANGLLEEGCGVEQGRIQFLAAWQEGAADVDLLVAGPSGQVAEVGTRSNDGLTKMRDCPGEGADCQAQNQENVLLDGPDAKPGDYVARVRLEDLGGEQPPIVVRVGVRISGRTHAYRVELREPGSEAFVRLVEKPASLAP